jgi:hypothetical protein
MTAIDNYDPLDEAEAIIDHHTAGSNGDSPRPEPGSTVDVVRSKMLDIDQLRALPPPAWLVDGYLVRDSLAVLYGRSGAGKTFGGLDLALHVAVGQWWHGREATAAPVVYLIAEGVAGLAKRVDAWQEHHRIYDLGRHQPIRWLPEAVNLTDRPDVEAFAAAAAELAPGLIVIDTLARCIAGADENSARDIGVVVTNLDRIRRVTGACVLAIHHTGKDASQGSRGSSALRGAIDTELELGAAEGRLTLKVQKQKDAAEAAPLRLALIPAGPSCVLVPSGQVAATDEMPAGAVETLDALREIEVPGGIGLTAWHEQSGKPRTTFMRHRKQLLACGLVVNLGTEKQPRYGTADVDGDVGGQ